MKYYPKKLDWWEEFQFHWCNRCINGPFKDSNKACVCLEKEFVDRPVNFECDGDKDADYINKMDKIIKKEKEQSL